MIKRHSKLYYKDLFEDFYAEVFKVNATHFIICRKVIYPKWLTLPLSELQFYTIL